MSLLYMRIVSCYSLCLYRGGPLSRSTPSTLSSSKGPLDDLVKALGLDNAFSSGNKIPVSVLFLLLCIESAFNVKCVIESFLEQC